MAKRGRNEDMPAWYKEMEKDLECPVCLNGFLDPPIYVCVNQHCLCSTCKTNLMDQKKACPVCNGNLTETRCLLAEKMLDRLPKTECVFPECSFKRADHQAVLDHQQDCSHRKVPCGICEESIALSSLNNHLKTKHDKKVFTIDDENQWDVPFLSPHNDRPNQSMMQASPTVGNESLQGVTFYFNLMLLNAASTNMMIWVSYNGPKKDAQKYQFSIQVLNKKGQDVLSGKRFCVPYDTPRKVVKEDNLGVIINKKLAQEFNIDGNPTDEPAFVVRVQFFLTR